MDVSDSTFISTLSELKQVNKTDQTDRHSKDRGRAPPPMGFLLSPTVTHDLHSGARTQKVGEETTRTSHKYRVYVLSAPRAQMMIWEPLACFCVSLISPSITLIALPELC